MTAAPWLGGDWLAHRRQPPDHVNSVRLIEVLPAQPLVEADRRRRLEDAFLALNPDFGVIPEHDHAGQHRLAYDREQAISLGLRHVLELRAENTGPAHRRNDAIRQRGDDARVRAHHRSAHYAPMRPPEREGIER
ncbi:MAG: hypothetical protein ACRDZO_23125 [Egibacteraceae bacterium]